MGCFLSTTSHDKNAATKPPKNVLSRGGEKKLDFNSNLSITKSDRTPPPTYEEETVVKEVLSETPKSKLTISRFEQNDDLNPQLLNDTILKKPRMVFKPDELSEDASEICSTLSECVSTATEKLEIRDDISKIRQKSPAKYHNRQVSGDRLVGRSPVRRSEPSPGRVRSGPGRDGSGFVGNNNGQRRGAAQSPDRRSSSPAMRVDGSGSRTGLSRCQSARRTGKSPGRVGSEVNGKIRKAEDCNGNNKDNKFSPTSDESLENPLVSLECFIFL